jgi:hypothetical protein
MTRDELKALVGQAAIACVEPGTVIGVGTGSTVNCFIDALARVPVRIAAAVSSSEQSTARLRALGIEVRDANAVETLDHRPRLHPHAHSLRPTWKNPRTRAPIHCRCLQRIDSLRVAELRPLQART